MKRIRFNPSRSRAVHNAGHNSTDQHCPQPYSDFDLENRLKHFHTLHGAEALRDTLAGANLEPEQVEGLMAQISAVYH